MNKKELSFQTVKLLSLDEKRKIMELWNNEYSTKLIYPDLPAFENYLDTFEQPTHIVVRLNDEIVG